MTVERSGMSTWERVGEFGLITLDNPPQNYLANLEFVDLGDLRRWVADESLRGVVITGKGRHFCAGADRESIFAVMEEEQIRRTLRRGKAVFEYLMGLPVPAVAAIRGACLGGGLELALSCHARVAGERAMFSFPETGLNVMPGLNGTCLLPPITGLWTAVDLVLTGRMIGAEEALRMRLVDHVVPTAEVLDFSFDLLRRLTADRPAHVLRAVMEAFHGTRVSDQEDAIQKGLQLFARLAAAEAKARSEVGGG